MEFHDIIEKAKLELKALQGEAGKNKTFQFEQRYFSSETAYHFFTFIYAGRYACCSRFWRRTNMPLNFPTE